MNAVRRGGPLLSRAAQLLRTVGETARCPCSRPLPASNPFPAFSPFRPSFIAGSPLSTEALNIARTGGTCEDYEMSVKNFQMEECGKVTLGGDVFDVPLRPDIIQRVVRWQLAKRRQGTHSSKTRLWEVNKTNSKPWTQKGSGRARHGTLKGPQFRGGIAVHGPKPRNHEIGLQKKVRKLGLKVALSARVAEGKFLVMDNLEPPDHKTKFMASFVETLGGKKVLMVDGEQSANAKLVRAASNLHYVNVLPVGGLNVYSILQHDILVMSGPAVHAVHERLRRGDGQGQSEKPESSSLVS